MHLILKIVGWECWCRTRSRVFNDENGYYVRCLKCGKRFSYDWEHLGALRPQQTTISFNPDFYRRHEVQQFDLR